MHKELFDLGWEYREVGGLAAFQHFEPGQPVNLPHDAMIGKTRDGSNPSAFSGGYFPGSVATYSKKFLIPEGWRGQTIQLEFEGVYMNAEVFINKRLVALHPYGYTSFIVDITPYLLDGQENEVSVIANNTAQPNSRWYAGTGIYRHVWLRRGGPVHIQPWGVFVTAPCADPAKSVVEIVTEISSQIGISEKMILRSTVLDAGGEVVAQHNSPVKDLTTHQKLTLEDVLLWSVDDPNLYTLRSEILLDGAVVDQEETTFGIRSITVDAENGFHLNGVPLKLKGGCIHHDHGPLGAASYDRAEERKVELLKAAGFNALRTAHNPPAPALLDACDRLGMLVIDETFDCWRIGKNPNDYHIHFEEWWQRDTDAMVKRDRNHPSIIMWSIGNEVPETFGLPGGTIWGQRQADYVRSLDHTRFVTLAIPINFLEEQAPDNSSVAVEVSTSEEQEGWAAFTRDVSKHLDVVGYNYLRKYYEVDHVRFPHRVIAGTETFPHEAYTYWMETERHAYVIGDFVWTAFDYLGEAGIGAVQFDEEISFAIPYPYHLANCGDFDICGFKRPQSYFRDLLWGVRRKPYIAVVDPQHHGKKISFKAWGWEPVIESWSFPGEEGKPTQVDVYAIDDEIELIINGVSVGRKPAGAASENKVNFEVTYQPGTIEAIGYTDGEETTRTSLKTATNPASLILTADRSVLKAIYGDLAYVTVQVVDSSGVVVKHGEPNITFAVDGVGELIALGAANPLSEEAYIGINQRKAYRGHLLAIIRTTGQVGTITLKAESDGLPATQIQLQVQ